MPRKTVEVTLRGRTFKVSSMPCSRQYRLLPKVTEVVSAVIGKAAPLFDGLTANADMAVLLKALPSIGELGMALAAKLPPDELDALVRELLSNALVKPLDGSPEQLLLPIMDEELSGETKALFELLWIAVKLNYSDFGDGLAALLRRAVKAKPEQSSPV